MKKRITINNDINETFEEGAEEFIKYCKVRNLREATIKIYEDFLLIWYKFYPCNSPINKINNKTIEDFILFLKENRQVKDVSINFLLPIFTIKTQIRLHNHNYDH